LAINEGTSVAELIRMSVDALLRRSGSIEVEELYWRAISAAGKLQEGPEDLSTDHDRHLQEALGS
jgi:hypothetical protein